jgi:dipeptidyl aminopeptidase/acylaminoacyl peptidase
MRIHTTAALLIAVPVLVIASASAERYETGQAPLRVDKVTISTPTTLKEIDTDKAQPSRLAWSPDGSQLYVQTFEGTFLELNQGKATKVRHYVFSASDGTKKDGSAEPDWAREYWSVKSGQASPDNAAFKIDVKTAEEVKQTTAAPMGGDLAKGGTVGDSGGAAGGAGTGDVSAAAFGRQRSMIYSMLLKGETIGRFENTVLVPGLTYGWGPKGTNAIAFASQNSGRVVVMDGEGAKKEIGGTKDAVLPAWSPDGKKVAWLQKDGKKKFLLQAAAVSGS